MSTSRGGESYTTGIVLVGVAVIGGLMAQSLFSAPAVRAKGTGSAQWFAELSSVLPYVMFGAAACLVLGGIAILVFSGR